MTKYVNENFVGQCLRNELGEQGHEGFVVNFG